MCRLRNKALERVTEKCDRRTDRQKDGRTDRQTDKAISMCRYASQATQKLRYFFSFIYCVLFSDFDTCTYMRYLIFKVVNLV